MSGTSARPKVSVVIPVFNEKATVAEVLRRVQGVELDLEIVVVDDGSTDGTREFLSALSVRDAARTRRDFPDAAANIRTDNIRVFLHDKNRGKGAAVRRGILEARGECILIQDADLEYNPLDYHGLLAPIESGVADVVFGSRFLGGPHRVLYFWHYLGNKGLTLLSNMFTNLNLTDVWTCYKVFRREVFDGFELQEERFGFEPEVTAKVARGKWRVYEVPISYSGRTYEEGKKIGFRDVPRSLWSVLKYGLFRSGMK
jgi:glycosyltransferase involved in cell wall biosynthesis